MSDVAIPRGSEDAVDFAQLSSLDRIVAVAEALEHNGVRAFIVQSGHEARQTVASLIPPGAGVFNNTSRTLESIGVADDIERSGRYEPLRLRLFQMDREMQARVLFASTCSHCLPTSAACIPCPRVRKPWGVGDREGTGPGSGSSPPLRGKSPTSSSR